MIIVILTMVDFDHSDIDYDHRDFDYDRISVGYRICCLKTLLFHLMLIKLNSRWLGFQRR